MSKTSVESNEVICYLLGVLLLVVAFLIYAISGASYGNTYPLTDLIPPLLVGGFVFIAIGLLIGALRNLWRTAKEEHPRIEPLKKV